MQPDDFDAWLDDYEPRAEEVQVGLDYGLVAAHGAVEAELTTALVGTDPESVKDLARRLLELQDQIQESGQLFRFVSVTNLEWQDMMRDHPPTEEQLARDKWLDHNPDTFRPEAMAACSVDGLTAAYFRKAHKKLGNADWLRLWETVWLVNREVATPPKSPLVGVAHLANAAPSATPARKASRARSSAAARGDRSRATSTRKATSPATPSPLGHQGIS